MPHCLLHLQATLGMPGPAAWANGLTKAQKAEWLVDCYRQEAAAKQHTCSVALLFKPSHFGQYAACTALLA
jgi:hypothetical protein